MVVELYTAFTVLGMFAVIGWLILVIARGSGEKERRAEEAAREHFDRYGRWPDES